MKKRHSAEQIQERAAAHHQRQRLLVDAPNRIAAYTIETDIIENLKRIYYHAKRISRTVLPPDYRREEH